MSDTNSIVTKVTGSVTSIGSLDRFTAQFFDAGFLQELVGTGTGLTATVLLIGVSAIVFLVLVLGILDVDERLDQI